LPPQSLKSKTTSGLIWNFVEKFSVTAGQFVVGVILARLLTPEDFGLVGMLSIFIAFSQTFVQSGLGAGLIQKQERTDIDFSSVFVFNLVVSLVIYLLLFIVAPLIAEFYERPQLTNLTRVLSITLIFGALSIVQRTKLTIEMDFKTHAKVNAVSLAVGGFFSISAALYGLGVWALIINTLLIAGAQSVGYWMIGNWSFSLTFSWESFKNLFGYGSKLLAASLYAKSLQEIYNIIIGKAYNATQLGFYTQTKKIGDLSASTLTSILQKVTFPLLSSLQNNTERMVSIFRRLIKMVAFITIPSMVLIAVLAEPIIGFLLGVKWMPVVPLLQWYCFVKIFYPIGAVNLNILKATGRSDLFLMSDLLKLPFVIVALIITIPISVEAMVIGQVVAATFSSFINAYFPGKIYGYGYFSQLKDMLPFIAASIGMAILVLFSISFFDTYFLQLVVGVAGGCGSYCLLAYLQGLDELNEFVELAQKNLIKLEK
jgi:O-antigen/teichoic acid export membrane protein